MAAEIQEAGASTWFDAGPIVWRASIFYSETRTVVVEFVRGAWEGVSDDGREKQLTLAFKFQ